MATGRDQAHSILELVAQQPRCQAEQGKPLTNDPGKQVAIDDGKQCIKDKGGLEVVPNADFNDDFDRRKFVVHGVPGQRLSARRRKILCGLAGLTIILGAILGGVLGARHKNSATVSVAPTQRNIAAVSFPTDMGNFTKVYFQDDVGQILEASIPGKNLTWNMNKTGFSGKNGSAIAATALSSSEISIFYLDEKNLIHDISCTGLAPHCTSGTVSAEGYIAMSNSSLTAMYYYCNHCVNFTTVSTIIAFQDENGFVRIGNFTDGSWTPLRQLGQDLDPKIGTGLALAQYPIHQGMNIIKLFYQKSSGLNMALAQWQQIDAAGRADSWSLNEDIYDSIPSGAHIAAAYMPSHGRMIWDQILSLSTTGIKVHDTYPMAMANSTNNKKLFESVAVTTSGNAFAVVKQDGKADAIENWQVADDMRSWHSVSNVFLGGAWG